MLFRSLVIPSELEESQLVFDTASNANRIIGLSLIHIYTAALKNQQPAGEFSKLEIGEIRQAGSKYYVWVRETVGGTSTERVYAMYPQKKFTMKMSAAYDV